MAHAIATDTVPGADLDLRGDPERVCLPAGEAWSLRCDSTADSAEPSLSFVTWFLQAERVATIACASYDPPDDDWLSIAESLEFLPTEE